MLAVIVENVAINSFFGAGQIGTHFFGEYFKLFIWDYITSMDLLPYDTRPT